MGTGCRSSADKLSLREEQMEQERYTVASVTQQCWGTYEEALKYAKHCAGTSGTTNKFFVMKSVTAVHSLPVAPVITIEQMDRRWVSHGNGKQSHWSGVDCGLCMYQSKNAKTPTCSCGGGGTHHRCGGDGFGN